MKRLFLILVFILCIGTTSYTEENKFEVGAGYRSFTAVEAHFGYGGDFAKAVFYAVDDFESDAGLAFGGVRLRAWKQKDGPHEVYTNIMYGTCGVRFDVGLEREFAINEPWISYWDFKYTYDKGHHFYAGAAVRW